jgi:aconitate hydratase 2/2-methylisocitrate dehydratase
MGDDIPHVPNKRGGGLCLGGKIAPIFFNTMEDAGALPIEVDVNNLNMGDVIDVYPFKGEVRNHETNELLASFELKTDVLIDEVRAGGRIPLIIGRGLTTKAREALGLPHSTCSVRRKTWRKATAARWRRKWWVAPAAWPVFVRALTASRR